MIILDGSIGEGGGQILRSALALSIITQQPFRITRIRANRDKPGLQRQHLTAVRAAAEISNATLSGDAVNSGTLEFRPGALRAGDYRFAIGTAGSTTLVFQTVLPPLLRADAPSTLFLEGGTHNEHAPPYDYLADTFLPLINRMGPTVETALVCPGFYPAGGGKWSATITPATRLRPLELLERGDILRQLATAVTAALPGGIARRELDRMAHRLKWPPECFVQKQAPNTCSPGNYVLVQITSALLTETFSAIGRRGVTAEQVADAVTDRVRAYLASTAPVGDCLADQLLLPLALARGGSYRTLPLTRHTRTNIDVIRLFLPVSIETTEEAGGTVVIEVR
jgi:RNA 3'-terminal phosphate cyclase (ATP)